MTFVRYAEIYKPQGAKYVLEEGGSVTLLACPVCGGEIDQKVVKQLALDSASAELIHEKAHAGKLGSLVQLGSIAENYLKPEMLSLEAEFWKYVNKMMDKQKQFVKEIAEAEESERTELIERYEKEMVDARAELGKIQEEHKEILSGIEESLTAIGKKIVGVGIGKVGESITIKDLQSAFTSDEFTDRRSDEKGSDIVANVREGTIEFGKAAISVKYQEKWSGAFIQQLRENMAEERTRWGMLVSKAFPANALNEKAYLTKDGFLVVKPEYATVAFYGLREAIKSAFEAAKQARSLEERMQQERQIIEALRAWVSGERFRDILDTIDRAKRAAEEAQDLVRKWQAYAKVQGDKVYEKNREVIEQLIRGTDILSELRNHLETFAPVGAAEVGAKRRRGHRARLA